MVPIVSLDARDKDGVHPATTEIREKSGRIHPTVSTASPTDNIEEGTVDVLDIGKEIGITNTTV